MASVTSGLRAFPQGDRVLIEIENTDARGSELFQAPAALWPRFDPTGGVALTLYYPDATVLLQNQAMTRVALGVYRFEFDLADDDPVGVYTYRAIATHGGAQRGQHTGGFRVVTQ